MIGLYGLEVSLIISVGMSNVAGAAKESCLAALGMYGGSRTLHERGLLLTAFQIIGPQLICTIAKIGAVVFRTLARPYYLVCVASSNC